MDTSRKSKATVSRLLAVDQQGSVLSARVASQSKPLAYSPYGYRQPASGLLSLLGFNGEYQDPVTGHYLLGTGYHRAFNPVLMRFNSPDSWSPFIYLNAYAYLTGDPINFIDPEGHGPKRPPTKSKGSKKQSGYATAGGASGYTAPSSSKATQDSTAAGSTLEVPKAKGPSSWAGGNPNSSAESSPAGSLHSGGGKRGSLSSLFGSMKLSEGASGSRGSIASVSSQGSTSSNTPWTVNTDNMNVVEKMKPGDYGKFKDFMAEIEKNGSHPKVAADNLGLRSDYKLLDKQTQQYQIRLGKKHRLTFTLKDHVVEIRDVGGHT